MLHNAGIIDRLSRILLGIALLSLVFIGPRTPWGYFGIVLLLTGLAGWCPLYSLVGISTCPGGHARGS